MLVIFLQDIISPIVIAVERIQMIVLSLCNGRSL